MYPISLPTPRNSKYFILLVHTPIGSSVKSGSRTRLANGLSQVQTHTVRDDAPLEHQPPFEIHHRPLPSDFLAKNTGGAALLKRTCTHAIL